MNKKIIIKVWSILDAGGYDIIVEDIGMGADLIYKFSQGQPLSTALKEAERLAVVFDCYLVINDKEVRKPLVEYNKK